MRKAILYSTRSTEWETPQWLFDKLDRAFGFTLDVAATPANAKCKAFFTKEDDALRQRWVGRCWMNPPYGKGLTRWVLKAYQTARHEGYLVVALLPARTDTSWWHRYVQPHATVHFLEGRVRFSNGPSNAPFPSAIAIWWPKP